MPEIIFYVLIYIIEAFIIFLYSANLFCCKRNKWINIVALFVLYAGLFCISLFRNYILNILSFAAVNLLYIFFIYQTSFSSALFHSIITTTLMGMSELVLYSIMPHFIPDFFANAYSLRNIVILTVFSKTLYFVITFAISQLLSKKYEKTLDQRRTSVFLLCIPIITLFVMSTLFMICGTASLTPYLDAMISISAVLLLIVNLLIFAINIYNKNTKEAFTDMQILLQREYDSAEYYKMLIEQTENNNLLIHDIKQHLNSIAILNEQKEHEKVATYIFQITSSIDLKGKQRYCEHDVLNVIINRYKKQCEKNGVDLIVDIRSNTVDFISDNEITSLFSNLLDNAYNAANNIPNAFIELNVGTIENSPFTILTLVNSCRKPPVFNSKNQLITSKKNKLRHGYGMKSIEKVVTNNHGDMKVYYDQESLTFHTIITLKNKSRKNED